MTDKVREEFEAAYVEDMVRIMGEGIRRRATENTKFLMQNGEFQDPALRLALWAWKASRESLVIELPDDGIEDCQKAWGTERCKDTFDCGYNFASLRHEQAIEAASLKVKP